MSVSKTAAVLMASLCGFMTASVVAGDWEIQPSLKVGSTYSDNIGLDVDGDSDLATEVSPGIRVSRESRRLDVDLDYSLQNLIYADDSGLNSSNHRLSADVTAEAIADTLFVDLNSSVSQRLVDRRTSASADAISGSGNLTDVFSYSISPYWQQRVGDIADFELRYTYDEVNSDDASDSDANAVAFDINNGSVTGPVYWNANYDNQQIRYSDGDKSDTESARGRLGYHLTRSFSTFVSGAYENNEFFGDRGDVEPDDSSAGVGFTWAPSQDFRATLAYNERLDPRPDEDETFASGDIFWAPTPRTTLNLGADNGFFGETYNGNFSHRTRWTRWNFNYSEGTSNFRSLFLEQGLVVCTLVGAAFTQCRVLTPGESPQPGEVYPTLNGQFFSDVNVGITDDTFINETGRASVSIVGARNTVTLSATNTRRTFVADNDKEKDSSLNLSWTYEVAPYTDSRITVGRSKEQFDDGLEDDFMRYAWRVTRRISGHSIFYVEAQMIERDSSAAVRRYDENRLAVSFERFF